MRRKRASRAGEAETPVVSVPPSRVAMAAAVVDVYKNLARIEKMCESSDFKVSDRWKIADLAKRSMAKLEEPLTENNK